MSEIMISGRLITLCVFFCKNIFLKLRHRDAFNLLRAPIVEREYNSANEFVAQRMRRTAREANGMRRFSATFHVGSFRMRGTTFKQTRGASAAANPAQMLSRLFARLQHLDPETLEKEYSMFFAEGVDETSVRFMSSSGGALTSSSGATSNGGDADRAPIGWSTGNSGKGVSTRSSLEDGLAFFQDQLASFKLSTAKTVAEREARACAVSRLASGDAGPSPPSDAGSPGAAGDDDLLRKISRQSIKFEKETDTTTRSPFGDPATRSPFGDPDDDDDGGDAFDIMGTAFDHALRRDSVASIDMRRNESRRMMSGMMRR